MMQLPRMLCRLHVPVVDDPRRDTLAEGLRRHILHDPLVNIVVHIQGQQQVYVVVSGCAGCRTGRCVVGCRRVLFERVLRATWGRDAHTTMVSGLAARPLPRRAIAVPSVQAQPLDGAILTPYRDARLVVGWQATGERISVGALLWAGTEGPDPGAILAAHGWVRTTLSFQQLLPGAGSPAARPGLPPCRARWPGTIFLGTAVPPATIGSPEQVGELGQPNNHDTPHGLPGANDGLPSTVEAFLPLLATGLPRVLAGEAVFQRTGATVLAPPDPAADGAGAQAPRPDAWPDGPGSGKGQIVAAYLERFVRQAIADERIVGEHDGCFTLPRIRAILGELYGEKGADPVQHGRALFLWLHQAGLLSEPEDPVQPFRKGRRWVTRDPDAIRTLLADTPLPTDDALRAAREQGLK